MYSIIKSTSNLLTKSNSIRTFSTTLYLSSEGAPSGRGNDALSKREKSEEERYIREAEAEKIRALKSSIEASKKHLEQLEKDHATLNGEAEKKK